MRNFPAYMRILNSDSAQFPGGCLEFREENLIAFSVSRELEPVVADDSLSPGTDFVRQFTWMPETGQLCHAGCTLAVHVRSKGFEQISLLPIHSYQMRTLFVLSWTFHDITTGAGVSDSEIKSNKIVIIMLYDHLILFVVQQ